MSLSATDYLLWVTGGGLLVLTAGALIKRKLLRELPVFSGYVLFHVYEVYCWLFRNYDGLPAARRHSVRGRGHRAADGGGGHGVVRTGRRPRRGGSKELVLLERSVRVMQCGLVFFLFQVSFYFGVAWQNYLFGIALGFGVFASIELVAVAVRGWRWSLVAGEQRRL